MKYFIGLISFTVILAGCSSGPSEDDIKAALNREADRDAVITQENGISVLSVKKSWLGCSKVESDTYECLVDTVAVQRDGGFSAQNSTVNLTLVQEGDNWIVVKAE